MKKIIATLLLPVLCSSGLLAQGKPSANPYFVLSSYVPDQGKIQSDALKDALQNKMNQITASNGMGGGKLSSRFILVPRVVVSQFENMPSSAIPKLMAKLDVNLYIGDAQLKILFKTEVFKATGIGQSEQEAYVKAINGLPQSSEAMKAFIESGKQKIVEYFTNNCDRIMKDVEAKTASNQFDDALQDLLSVPPEASGCYDKAMARLPGVFRSRQEWNCSVILQKARAEVAGGNEEAAALTLGQIIPGTKCAQEADAVLKQLNQQHLRKYQDRINMQMQLVDFIKEWALTEARNRPIIYSLNGWMF
jgi:hypothetical protein